MHLPLVWGLLESSIESFSCCMNSLPYTLLSCQMLSNRSKGFLQPSSASLFKDQKIVIVRLENIPYVLREHLPNQQLHPLQCLYIWRESLSYCLRQTVQNTFVANFPLFLEPKIASKCPMFPCCKGRLEEATCYHSVFARRVI